MKVLFLGGLFDKKKEKEILKSSRGNVQSAANVFQWNIINGLIENKVDISIISLIYIGSFPKLYKNLIIKSQWINDKTIKYWKYVGFYNLIGLKHVFRTINSLKEVIKWCKVNKEEDKAIIVYAMHTPFMISACIVKKIFNNIKINIVIPDLPEYMDLSQDISFIKKVFKYIDIKINSKLIKYFDSYVVLTEPMINKLKIRKEDSIVIEGIINKSDIIENKIDSKDNSNIKSILYTGTLNKAYGIMDLLNAFLDINDKNYELWICGEGEAKKDIINLSNNDSRIKYFGLISREKALELQKKATVLINPRNDSGEYTKYSFPSKIMEYMLSGTPSIIYRLSGIPHEYFENVYLINGVGVNAIKQSIINICEKDENELKQFGFNAQKFVLENKNSRIQTKKIIDLLKIEV